MVLAGALFASAACSEPPSGGAGGAPSSSASAGGGASGAGGDSSGVGGSSLAGPWVSTIERCDGADDEDSDGLVDEDCAPSLWAGAYVPGGSADFKGDNLTAVIEKDAGRPLSVIQTYHGTSKTGVQKTGPDLLAIWEHGATPHLNVEPSGYKASQYAAPASDPGIGADLSAMAGAIAGALSSAPQGRLLLTFGAEMNGDWTDWGCLSPATYISFYRKAHDVVTEALSAAKPPIDPRRVRWVYGPNSTSSAGCGSSADYYPGHDVVDYIGMSAYRPGKASVASSVVGPATALLKELGYPEEWQLDRFIVLQTGTRDEAGDDSGAFMTKLFSEAQKSPIFRGIIYFNSADWALLKSGAPPAPVDGYEAWTAAMSGLPPADARLEATFAPFFWDVQQSSTYYAEIQSLRAAGTTSGCASAPARFCPKATLLRSDAAVLIARAFNIKPDVSSPPLFDDVPGASAAFGAVQSLAALGALPGCSATSFCPADPIRRDALASALAKISSAPAATGAPHFNDLDNGSASASIEALAALGHIDGCSASSFCPSDPALRDAGAAWIVRAAGIPPAPPP